MKKLTNDQLISERDEILATIQMWRDKDSMRSINVHWTVLNRLDAIRNELKRREKSN